MTHPTSRTGREALASLVLALSLVACDDGAATDAGTPADAGGSTDAGGLDAGTPPPDAGPGDHDAGAPTDGGGVRDPLVGIGPVEMVQGGFMFLEGPRWREADGVLLFTDIPASTIRRLMPPSTFDVFRNPSGMANGLATLPDGRLLAAEHENRRVSVTANDGTVTDFAARDAMGRRFNSPNDVAVRSDGNVYFTDPPYGLTGTREIPFNGVFRVDPSGTVSVVWMSSSMAQRPNGIVISPDEATLYVDDTNDAVVRAFDIASDGSVSGERMFATGVTNADGMAIDTAGNLFVSTANGVIVFDYLGSRWGRIAVPQQPANCGFGDADHRTLYITAQTGLYRVRMRIPGMI
ncbi:MAG: SMP-30/gluconolactonase/LRE family protein [Sandaracinaceae bacterium]